MHELGTALAPGGLLLIEDWETRPADQMVASAPSREDAALFAQYQQAASDLLGRRGHDSTWARRTHAAMLEEELADVETVVSASTWPGGSHGCRHALAAHGQMRPHLVEAGMTDRQLDRVAALLEDPAFVLHGRLLHSVSGWRLAGRRLRSGASRLS